MDETSKSANPDFAEASPLQVPYPKEFPPPYVPPATGASESIPASYTQPYYPETKGLPTQQPMMQPGVYPQHGMMQPGVYPQQGMTQPGVYLQQPIMQPGVYPHQGMTQPGGYPQQPMLQAGVYPQQGMTQPGVYSQHPMTQPGGYQQQPMMQPVVSQPNASMVTVMAQPAAATIAPPSYNDYLCWSIFSMLCCCFPIGFAALIYSCKAQDAIVARDPYLSRSYSGTARKLNIAALAFGIMIDILVIILYLDAPLVVLSLTYRFRVQPKFKFN